MSESYSWWSQPVSSLKLPAPLKLTPDASVSTAVKLMKANGREELAVLSNTGSILGVLSLDHLLKKLTTQSISGRNEVRSVVSGQFKIVAPSDTLGKLTYILQGTTHALVMEGEKLVGIANQMDLAEVAVTN